MTRILVIGRDGQLARSLAEVAQPKPNLRLSFIGRPTIDLERPDFIEDTMRKERPDLVINAAAFTEVDNAESQAERAFQINAVAAGVVSGAAAKVGAAIIQISTDYVFDGTGCRPYREDDPTNPINVYGASKLAGEQAVRDANGRHLILRTSWLYSPFGRNFVATMLNLAGTRSKIDVVADQVGSPTSSIDLAEAIVLAIEAGLAEAGDTFHFAGSGQASWAEFAAEIMLASEKLGGPHANVSAIPSQQWPTAARRPSFSALDCSRFDSIFGARPGWRSSVSGSVERLLG